MADPPLKVKCSYHHWAPKLSIRRKESPKAENDQPDTSPSIFDHRARGLGSTILHTVRCRLMPGHPPKCTVVRYLCGIQYRMEFVESQVRHCKNRSRATSRGETLKPLENVCKNGNTFDTIFDSHGYNSSFPSQMLARLRSIPEGSATGIPEEMFRQRGSTACR
jgi:hypothetical protein